MEKRNPVRIVPLAKPHRGKYPYLVDYTKHHSGERGRSYFLTEDEARAFADRTIAEQQRENDKITLRAFVPTAIEFIRGRGTKKYTALGYQRAVRGLLKWFPEDRKLESLEIGELAAKMSELSEGIYNLNLIGLRLAFDFAVSCGHLNQNPLAPLHMRPRHKGPSSVLKPQTVARFLDALARVAPDLAAIHSLLFFSGVTFEEVARMTRADIDLEKRRIYVSSKAARNGRARALEIAENLNAWLLATMPQEGPLLRVHLVTAYKVRAQVCSSEGLPSMGRNAAAETFLYYRRPLVGIRAILEAGLESEPKGMWSKGCATSVEECEAYWSIFPTTSAGMVAVKGDN